MILLFIAYAILLGHSIIPHHHHNSVQEAELHHFHEPVTQHNNNSGEASGHGHSPHLVHDADFGKELRTSSKSTINFSKQLISLFKFCPLTFSLTAEANSCLQSRPPDKDFLIYFSPHSLASGLRAPPAFIS